MSTEPRKPSLEPVPNGSDPLLDATQQILQTLRSIRFGSVEIVIHDSRIVQIERREKLRLSQ